jgi:uncharacterized protein YndB with AHSA1/START domain
MTDLIDLRELRLRRQQWIAASPAQIYELISDVSAMPTWSPDLVSADYDDGHGPSVGAWFTGLNKDEVHEWQVRMQVTEAEPGVAFAWTTMADGLGVTRWRYAFQAQESGTLVEETWHVLRVTPLLGSTKEELLELRARTVVSMETTLAALASSVAVSRLAS